MLIFHHPNGVMAKHRTFPLLFLLISSSLNLGATSSDKVGTHTANRAELLAEWLVEGGGVFNQKIEIRRADPSDPTSTFGVFAVENIAEKEIILSIPRSRIISAYPENQDEPVPALNCDLVRKLTREMRLGDESEYAPYVNYLLEEPWGQQPSAWSKTGKKILKDMLENYTKFPLPPGEPTEWIEIDWREMCRGSDDPFEKNVALIVVQRSWDAIMIPLVDMLNHRNGRWFNTESSLVHLKDRPIEIRTTRLVEAGEEIHGSYNMCEDCGGRRTTYGSPEILRDYGFVEQYPQRWIVAETVGFEVFDRGDDMDGNNLDISWIFGHGEEKAYDVLHNTLRGLKLFQDRSAGLELVDESILPRNELEIIRNYHQAFTKAVSLALIAFIEEGKECKGDEFCSVANTRYKSLMEDAEKVKINYKVCDRDHFYDFEGYYQIDEVKTTYQTINTMHHPTTKETCFDLDDTVQQCTGYRPHYHEMMVHYATRYLQEIKRVLFVGGGDSMLLSEILKYPSLEVVVGLELDQQVTRSAFKHFGSQPHWHNDKVEWWYGDARNSILMLPSAYFGSFDLVLVDLSETVMSFKVTNELDIMSALALLLKPEGIMVKNELYFPKMTGIFVHTSQIHFADVPVLCSQAFSLGSQRINFLQQPLIDHNVDSENLFMKPLDADVQNGIIHDYEYVPDNLQKYCKKENNFPVTEVPKTQEKSPGIILIIEAEDATLVPKSSKALGDVMVQVLEKEGLTVLSVVISHADNSDAVSIVILKEGYVVSRAWLAHEYCAFDVYFWSNFDRYIEVGDALISAVGSTRGSSSSYRIVAGGMFGVSTWKKDAVSRGPHRTISCDTKTNISEIEINKDAMDVVLEESMEFVEDVGDLVIVICGQMDSEPCRSAEVIKKKGSYKNIQVIWSCPNLNEFSEDYFYEIYACEVYTLKVLFDSMGIEKNIQAVFFDSTASYEIGQVLFKIFSNFKYKLHKLIENTTVISVASDEGKLWQRNFVSNFLKNILEKEPAFKGEVSFKSLYSSINLNVASKDETFIKSLKAVASTVELRTGIASEIINLYGGQVLYRGAFEFSQWFKHTDYDQTSALEQWNSQMQLEHQNIFQLNKSASKSELSIKEVRFAFDNALHISGAENIAEEFTGMGEGCVLVAIWSRGWAVAVWDGREILNINVCTEAGNDFSQNSQKFFDFQTQIGKDFKVVLHDRQPRGYGRVVNFLKDINNTPSPRWS